MLVLRPISSKGRVTAICLGTDAVGDVVYVTGPMVGNDYQVGKVDILDYTKMPGVGVIIYKISPTRAIVQLDGDVSGIYSGLIPGRVYFIGSAGTPVATPPTPGPSQRLYHQPVGVAVSSNVLRILPKIDPTVRIG